MRVEESEREGGGTKTGNGSGWKEVRCTMESTTGMYITQKEWDEGKGSDKEREGEAAEIQDTTIKTNKKKRTAFMQGNLSAYTFICEGA